ncbi:Sorbose reductase [Wickerhamomyces ciferrii]|uniref:Sorbose reductase n=1 Tax=Wickerhamomyces ciferrii (strain ATCC 14091 / BCRC 22168 / CBS 111 / JCM 3599 / NBRC 0793 / NRRL Y-1031 F-60-10) TaxID=1206466 RepID=K0KPH4_WICCF|nr:Sorbose reductase [Wickerhamomyces ciferrii]CCH43053.1 Sorbose reductase [Wickerhamomyces ciferrii]
MSKTLATQLDTPQPFPQIADNVLDLFSLKGKVASITGSSTGIGLEVAKAYAQAGADVAIWYNSHPADDKAKEISEKYGVRAKAYKVSLTDFKSIDEAIKQIELDFGTIDIFVSNAGKAWTGGGILDQSDDTEWKDVIDLDLNSIYYLSRAIGKIFKKKGTGTYIITASMSGHVVNIPQMQSGYNAAKAAVIHFAKSLAVEWSGFARVNTVSPGYIATELTKFADSELKKQWWSLIPMGREALPKELVGAYLYLASDASSYVTGTDIRVDGGYTAL